MNAGIAGPITGVMPPYLLGAIATLKTAPATVTLMVYDPRNAQDWDVISHPFSQGTTTALTITFPTKISGLPGFYTVRGVYDNMILFFCYFRNVYVFFHSFNIFFVNNS